MTCAFCLREVEPAENNLKEMLQQLNSFLATKPSEKVAICQGERTSALGSVFVCLPTLYTKCLFFL